MQTNSLSLARHLLSYNERLAVRSLDQIDMLVIHCTELPNLEMAREFGEKIIHEQSKTGNSGHFYIDQDGRLQQWVELERVAHHVRGMNERSIGIELDNAGRYPHWYHSERQAMTRSYPAAQIQTLVLLINALEKLLPSLAWLAGHEELDNSKIPAEDDASKLIRRKVDPGPLFPWQDLSAASSLSRWPTESEYGK